MPVIFVHGKSSIEFDYFHALIIAQGGFLVKLEFAKYSIMFNNSKYTRWYYQLMDRARSRNLPTGSYIEKHHIIPRCLGGNDSLENLAKLTAREHFIAHWLLTKMTTDDIQKKLAYACKRMMHSKNANQTRYKVSSRIYENLKKQLNITLKNRKFSNEWLTKLKQSAQKRAANESAAAKETRRKTLISANKSRKGETRLATTGEKNPMFGVKLTGENNHFFGKNHSEDTLKKLRVPKSKYTCVHCNKIVGGESNLKRWHNNNCKLFKESLCQD
jgi:hypothetical protein